MIALICLIVCCMVITAYFLGVQQGTSKQASLIKRLEASLKDPLNSRIYTRGPFTKIQ